MKKRKIKILSYGLYLLISIGLMILLFTMRSQYNWISGGLRELFSYLLISLTVLFSGISIIIYLKSKKRKIITLGIIGVIPCLIVIPFFKSQVYTEKNSLNDNLETIELTYIAWSCDCANWATKKDLIMYSENIRDSLSKRCIFIEPTNKQIILPDTIGYGNDVIRLAGQYYNKKGFPKGYDFFGEPEKARVFRFTKYEIIKSNYGKYKKFLIENE